MPNEFTAIGSCIRLSKQQQSAALVRLHTAISCHPLIQGQADLYFHEYRKYKGNTPLSMKDMLELWGWSSTFDQITGDLVALTTFRTEIEDEQLEQMFFNILAPDLDDGNYVEVDIDYQRRRYVAFHGKMYQLDATYVYPTLHKKIAQAKGLYSFQKGSFPDEKMLPHRYRLHSGGEKYEQRAYMHMYDGLGLERAYWSSEEWRDAPEEVVGAIFETILHPERFAGMADDQSVPTNSRGQDEKLAAKVLTWNGERLSYSQPFAVLDGDGELQIRTEECIAAHLFDEYKKFDLFGHVRWIVAFVAESFFQDVLHRPVIDMLQLMETLPEYLATWQHQLTMPNAGPDQEETAMAGRDTLLITLRFLYPGWVQIDSGC